MTGKCCPQRDLVIIEEAFVVLEQESSVEKMACHALKAALPGIRLVEVIDVGSPRPAFSYVPRGSQLDNIMGKLQEGGGLYTLLGVVHAQQRFLGVRAVGEGLVENGAELGPDMFCGRTEDIGQNC